MNDAVKHALYSAYSYSSVIIRAKRVDSIYDGDGASYVVHLMIDKREFLMGLRIERNDPEYNNFDAGKRAIENIVYRMKMRNGEIKASELEDGVCISVEESLVNT